MKLSDQVEAATGADRVLDALIWDAVARPEADDPDRILEIHNRIVARIIAGGDDSECPRYTASIDAALTLVEEIRDFDLCKSAMSVDMGGRNWSAYINGHKSRAKGRTPALALCAAALRARRL